MVHSFCPVIFTKMIKQVFATTLLMVLCFACNRNTDLDKYEIVDQTKYRPANENPSDYLDLSVSEIQHYYNNQKIKEFEKALKSLNLSSFREIEHDTTAFRLIIDSHWSNDWSGACLSLEIYNTSAVLVKTAKLTYNSVDNKKQIIPFIKNDARTVDFDNFVVLDTALLDGRFWNSFSFEKNEGSISYDNRVYFIEARFKNKYKLLIREFEDSPTKNILIPFLKATNYSDSLLSKLFADQINGTDSLWD